MLKKNKMTVDDSSCLNPIAPWFGISKSRLKKKTSLPKIFTFLSDRDFLTLSFFSRLWPRRRKNTLFGDRQLYRPEDSCCLLWGALRNLCVFWILKLTHVVQCIINQGDFFQGKLDNFVEIGLYVLPFSYSTIHGSIQTSPKTHTLSNRQV